MPSKPQTNGKSYRLEAPRCQEDWKAFHSIRQHVFKLTQPEEVSGKTCHPLLLWHEETPVGAIQIDSLPNDAAALRLVAIDTPWQACGHGRALLRHAEDFVKGLGCRRAVVYATPEAAGFYSCNGYEEEEWDDTYLSGIVQMLKALD